MARKKIIIEPDICYVRTCSASAEFEINVQDLSVSDFTSENRFYRRLCEKHFQEDGNSKDVIILSSYRIATNEPSPWFKKWSSDE